MGADEGVVESHSAVPRDVELLVKPPRLPFGPSGKISTPSKLSTARLSKVKRRRSMAAAASRQASGSIAPSSAQRAAAAASPTGRTRQSRPRPRGTRHSLLLAPGRLNPNSQVAACPRRFARAQSVNAARRQQAIKRAGQRLAFANRPRPAASSSVSCCLIALVRLRHAPDAINVFRQKISVTPTLDA